MGRQECFRRLVKPPGADVELPNWMGWLESPLPGIVSNYT